ncbi:MULTISPECIES: hypothetical protein [Pantoea]|jgi:hypothetical protein|uniref:Uncharacterized protein n=1 Tax=Pantoea piersonii TaxID=2364647 RepID=A0AAJ5U9L7_9GAMM|nr:MULTISPECIES: hypothetical protein [Pantoea]MBZ6387847.1 hypothetical protein [Pantoea piersonii]MBZ6399557.1 hypothetical protein [Pantoea piersonii]MBZ6409760.1 hypothetical protein [Pantoea piersonii]MBZ6425576.1 hypothetical protein [Pantoea piersonii]NYB03396.1 hypothetical protein [Pantoea piersonii]
MTIAEQLKQEGRKEEKLEGKPEARLEVACSLLKMNMPREQFYKPPG